MYEQRRRFIHISSHRRVDKATAAREVLREASGSSAAPAPAPVPTASLEAWLKSRGAELGCLTVTDASATPEATPWASGRGLGLSVGPSGRPLGSFGGGLFRSGDKILARIPLAGALTADNVLTKQPYGHVLQDAVTAGIADPRTVIMAALVVERLRGRTSAFAAYLSALPESFTTPLYLSPAELGNLQGTPLHEATASMRERLRAQWTKLRPFVSKALTAAGAGEEVATFDDFLWAFNVFWSRGHQLPTGEDALIPGLDFANHALDPNAWWQYAPGKKGESGSILILAPTVPDVGAEITVSYGDKSDEELLFMHGFALGRNPHNRLMVQMDPTALALREASLAARCELMALEGGVPFLQLPSPECVEPPFPARALRCAEILTLAPAELEAELAAARSGRPGVHRGPTEDAVKWAEFKRRPLAEQMALLSVLRGLLEQTVEAMEDAAKGTGALEHDVQLLQRGGLPARVLPCVLYRAGLKRMAREWLVRAKAELAEVIADLREETGAAAV